MISNFAVKLLAFTDCKTLYVLPDFSHSINLLCLEVSYHFILERDFCKFNFVHQSYRFSKCLLQKVYTERVSLPKVLYDKSEINDTVN